MQLLFPLLDHPAIMERVSIAKAEGKIPSLLVNGGDAGMRREVARAYVIALVMNRIVSPDHVKVCDASRMRRFEQLFAMGSRMTEAEQQEYFRTCDELDKTPLLVVSELGADYEPPAGSFPTADYEVWTYGAEQMMNRCADARFVASLPTIITTPLPFGYRLGDKDRKIVYGSTEHDYTHQGLGHVSGRKIRDACGWTVPSAIGYDPDEIHLPEDTPLTFQEYVGGRVSWRMFEASAATAVDAAKMVAKDLSAA